MLNDVQKMEFNPLRFEIIDLNQSAFFYLQKMCRLGYLLKNTSRRFFLEEITAIRYLENGIILHLTNLDDGDSNYSFRRVSKVIGRISRNQAEQKVFNDKLKDFRQNINNIKVKHRIARIAHLNSEKFLEPLEFLSFSNVLKSLILEANSIADLLWNERIIVKYELGSIEGILDYREEVENSIIDFDKHSGFY